MAFCYTKAKMSFSLESLDLRPNTKEVIAQTLGEIDLRYHPVTGENPKPYHNRLHTEHVLAASLLIADSLNLPYGTKNDIAIAAANHDVIHDDHRQDNEARSAEEAVDRMREVGDFTGRRRDNVARLILSTGYYWHQDGRIIQRIDPLVARAANAVADADLSNLGGPPHECTTATIALYRERYPSGGLADTELADFLKNTAQLVGAHRYNLEISRMLFPNQVRNAKKILKMLDIVKKGLLPAEDLESDEIDYNRPTTNKRHLRA